MKMFSIDANDSIEVRNAGSNRSKQSGRYFASEEQWAKIAADLPMSRLVAIWNGIPGLTPVERFTSRAKAVPRIWKALQNLEPAMGKQPEFASKTLPPTEQPDAPAEQREEKGESKTAQVLALLKAQGGVSLEHLVRATGWQKHSIRGFLSGTVRRKMGLNLVSSKDASGARVYRIER